MTIAAPPPVYVEGIDVSGFQANLQTHVSEVDWQAVWDSGRRFALIKASEANTGVDLARPSHAEGAGHVGMWTGAYHFGHPDSGLGDARAEARQFRLAAGPQPLGQNLPPSLDIEVKPVLDPKAAAQWILDFLDECDQLFGRGDCSIYTNPSFWFFLGDWGRNPRFAQRPLWHSQYWLPRPRLTPVPVPPRPWTDWAVWQYGGGDKAPAGNEATCPGVRGWCDLNVFKGTPEQLALFAGAQPPPLDPLPPSGLVA